MFNRSTWMGAVGQRPLRLLLSLELGRARRRVSLLKRQFPAEDNRSWATRLIAYRRQQAATLGGVGGMFGFFSIPADLLAMLWLEWGLLCDMAALYRTHPSSDQARSELLEVFSYLEGVAPLKRASPLLVTWVSKVLVRRGLLNTVGRAVPLLAVPVGAWLNQKHVEKVGLEALRHFEGFSKVSEKARQGVDDE